MIDPRAELIIKVALATQKNAPDLPALSILDAVMIRHLGAVVHFGAKGQSWTDWLNPPSPFADLLRQAFAPNMSESNLEFWDDPRPDLAGATRDLWRFMVVEPFARRYGLRLI